MDPTTLTVGLTGIAGTHDTAGGPARASVIPGISSVALEAGSTNIVVVTLDGVLEPSALALSVNDDNFEFEAVPGDVNGSGTVFASDAVAAFSAPRARAGDSDYQIFADVNATGSVFASDATRAFGALASSMNSFVSPTLAKFASLSSVVTTSGEDSSDVKRPAATAQGSEEISLSSAIVSNDNQKAVENTADAPRDVHSDRDATFSDLSEELKSEDLTSGI